MALITSVQTGGVNNHPTTSDEANAVATDFANAGVVGTLVNTSGVAPMTGGFAVNAQGTPDTTIAVSTGVIYITATPTSQNSQKFRVKNTASANTTISANASGSTKYDWVYVKLDPTNLNAPNVAGDNAATIVVSRSTSLTVDDGTPPTYGYNISIVTVANGFATITNGNIRDTRIQAGMTTTTAASSTSSWSSLGATPSSTVDNGNRSYTWTFTATDLTSTVSNGMRVRATRTATAPTLCTSLNGTTQYYSKATPAGSSFTDDFVNGWWVKPTSYAVGTIASIYNGTSGWALRMNASGQIQLIGYNAGAANFSQVLSTQSIALNKWTHVAAQLDMSTFTAAPTTSYVMLDGFDTPAVVSRGGTNPTALVQAGNLNIGAENGGTNPFPGKIANGGFYSAKVTQATIRASRNQTLTGSETSLVSAYSFNGVITDLNTSNANNLTANSSALATSTDTPFAGGNVQEYTDGTTEMGIVMSVTFSTDTTMVVQVPEGYALPTSGGISAVSYSTQKVPYGFPSQRSKWAVSLLILASASTSGTVTGTIYNPGGLNLGVPLGEWRFTGGTSILINTNAAVIDLASTISTSSSAATLPTFAYRTLVNFGAVTTTQIYYHTYQDYITTTTTTLTPYYLLLRSGAAFTALQARGDLTVGSLNESTQLAAEPAYI